MNKPWLKCYDNAVLTSLTYPEMPVHAFLRQAAQKYPDRPCTIYRDIPLSYAVMDKLSDVFSAALQAMGVKKGDRVAVILPNIPQFVLAYYGILKAGGVVVAMNPMYKADEIQYHLDVSDAMIVLALDEYREVLDIVQERNPEVTFIFTSLYEAELSLGTRMVTEEDSLRLTTLLQQHEGKMSVNVEVSSDDPAIFQFSGGTTGIPKAAVGLHRNLVANVLQFSNWLVGLEEGEEVLLAAIPLYHVYGMVIGMGMAVGLGASMVLIDNARDIAGILQGIDHYQATLFPGVPNLYRAINHHPDVLAGKYRLRSIKACGMSR